MRQALADTHTTVPNQQSNPPHRPPMRWVFQRCAGIHVLLIAGQTAMRLNLNPPQQHVLQLWGPSYQALYP